VIECRPAFNVCLIQPSLYIHSLALLEAAEFLNHKLIASGYQSRLSNNELLNGCINVIFGGHLAPNELLLSSEKIVIFNTEQLPESSCWTGNKRYIELLHRFPVWDYSKFNLNCIPRSEKWLINFLFDSNLKRIVPARTKEFDLVFYGSLDQNRTSIIDDLERTGLKVARLFGVYGFERDEIISKSRAVLNLHYYKSKIFQQIRCFYPLINGIPVVSENFPLESCPEIYKKTIHHPTDSGIVDYVCELFSDPVRFDDISKSMLSMYASYSEDEDFNMVVEETISYIEQNTPKIGFKQTSQHGYYDGMNQKLFNALPTGRRKVLEIGCANGNLGAIYKALSPNSVWHGVDISWDAVAAATPKLDRVYCGDVEDARFFDRLDSDYDLVVMGDVLEHLKCPGAVLESLRLRMSPTGELVCCVPNMSHISVLRRMLASDLTYDQDGLLDRTHLRFLTPASSIKMFLDSGWLPDMVDEYRVEVEDSPVNRHLMDAATSLGIPRATAMRNLGCYQSIFRCEKWDCSAQSAAVADSQGRSRFSVIVPVNRPWQASLNVSKSPGLREVDAEIVYVEGASAAEAYLRGAARAKCNWHVFAHQDVYFPRGAGIELEKALYRQESLSLDVPIGFAGLAVNCEPSMSEMNKVGLVVDRTRLFRGPESSAGVSIDELAVCLNSATRLRIDPRLGWHLWATDLCLQAEAIAGAPATRVLNIPVFHNSVGEYTLPKDFYGSAHFLLDKHKDRPRIHSLCGEISR
jgi:2-polyprenyl-3-methyl-5-hydroxy-6-metoxy-1,4-benzoquinol methylase